MAAEPYKDFIETISMGFRASWFYGTGHGSSKQETGRQSKLLDLAQVGFLSSSFLVLYKRFDLRLIFDCKFPCSVWHVTIYTSSFFFLCSKVITITSENEPPADENYQLTRQDSIPRGA